MLQGLVFIILVSYEKKVLLWPGLLLVKGLHLKAYKIQLTHELKPSYCGVCLMFVNWALERRVESSR